MAATASEVYAKWRCRLIPDHVLGEMLFKSWIDNAIPVSILLATVTIFSSVVPGFLSVGGLGDNARQLGELMLVVLG
jgi:ribose transport system permease protein